VAQSFADDTMLALLHTTAVWLQRTLGWSNSRQSWLERGAGIVWLTLVALALRFGTRLGTGQRLLLIALFLLSLVALLRRGWVKLLGPVFFYDAVRSVRRGRYFLVRGVYTGLILGLLCWTYFVWRLRSTDGAIPVADLATFAESFFYVFLGVQTLAVLLLTPAYVAGAIAEEKEKHTLDYLLATDLHNREIVLGKLVSRLGNLALLVLAGLPILSLMEILGGVEPTLVIGAFAVSGVTMVTLAALSLLCSVHARRARDAILATYVLAFAYPVLMGGFLALVHFGEMQSTVLVPTGVMPWLTTTTPQDPRPENPLADPIEEPFAQAEPIEEPFTLGDLAERLNDASLPMFCVRLIKELERGSTVAEELPRLLRTYAAVNLTIAALCITWAVVVLRRVALRQRHRASVPLRGVAVVRRPPVGAWPFLWKEAIAESGFRASLARRAITYFTFIAVAVPTGALLLDFFVFGEIGARELTNAWVQMLVVGVPMLSLLAVAVRASAAVAGERDRQTLDPLLTIPVSSDAVLFNKWLGCLLGLRWTVLAVIAALAACIAMGEISLDALPRLLVVWPIYAGLIAMVGIAYSIACRTTLRATLATLLTTVGLVCGHWALWLVYVPFLLTSAQPTDAAENLLHLHVGLTPPCVLVGIVRSSSEVLGEGLAPLPFTLLGLALWCAMTLAAWFIASRQFRVLANRVVQQPPGPPPAEEDAVMVLNSLMRRGQRRRRIAVAIGVLVPVVAIVGAYVYANYESDRQLRAALAEIDAQEPGWRLAELESARKVLPIEENSAEQVRKVRRLMPRMWPAPAGPPVPAPAPPGPPNIVDRLPAISAEKPLSVEEEEELRCVLESVFQARDEALKLADMPDGRYPLVWASVVFWTTLNDQQESRLVAHLLRAESAYRAHTGDADGAVRAARAALNVARAIGDEPLLISQYIRMGERRVAIEALERALAQGEPSEVELARMQAALEAEEREPLLIRGYRSERAFYHESMEELRSGKLKPSQIWAGGTAQDLAAMAAGRTAHPWGLRHLSRLVALEGRPVHEQFAEVEAIDRETTKAPWIYQQMTGLLGTSARIFQRSQAWMRSAIVAVAAERFRRQSGRWPNSPAELVPTFLSAVPLDPSDGQPLRWNRKDDGIVIYSIGPDGQDHSGKLMSRSQSNNAGSDFDAGFDVGVRLWDVSKRRQKSSAP
jgi:ABC-type transport system involved in multi-copper enzyme maturation permease subunit